MEACRYVGMYVRLSSQGAEAKSPTCRRHGFGGGATSLATWLMLQRCRSTSKTMAPTYRRHYPGPLPRAPNHVGDIVLEVERHRWRNGQCHQRCCSTSEAMSATCRRHCSSAPRGAEAMSSTCCRHGFGGLGTSLATWPMSLAMSLHLGSYVVDIASESLEPTCRRHAFGSYRHDLANVEKNRLSLNVNQRALWTQQCMQSRQRKNGKHPKLEATTIHEHI